MPTIKLYSIVSNDDFEFPVMCDIAGRQAVADYMGISVTTLCRNVKSGKWKGYFKAIEVGEVSDLGDEFQANDLVKPLSAAERRERADRIREEKKKANKEKWKEINRERNRQDYVNNKEKHNARMKAYYSENKEKRCEYGKRYRKEIKEGTRVCFARSK